MREQRDALELRVAELSSFHDDEKGWRISAEASLASLREAARALVESLPKCDKCSKPATRALRRGEDRRCDDHPALRFEEPDGHYYRDAPEYPRAVPLRALVALLSGAEAQPTPTRDAIRQPLQVIRSEAENIRAKLKLLGIDDEDIAAAQSAIDRNVERIDSAMSEAQPTRAEVEIAALREALVTARDALHRDRTGLAAALNKILNAIAARSWLVEERGPYEWDDDRYKDEAGQAMRQVAEIARSALVASGTLAIEAIAGTDTELAIDRALSGNVSAYQERVEGMRETLKDAVGWLNSYRYILEEDGVPIELEDVLHRADAALAGKPR